MRNWVKKRGRFGIRVRVRVSIFFSDRIGGNWKNCCEDINHEEGEREVGRIGVVESIKKKGTPESQATRLSLWDN